MKNKKIVFLIFIIVLILVGIYFIADFISQKNINSFEECANAGYPIMESYPRQCKVPNGKTFVESIKIRDNLEFTSGNGGCSTSASSETKINVEGNNIIFSGSLKTPNPCYTLTADLKQKEDNLFLTLSSEKINTMCIQCVGEIKYSGKIKTLKKGTYNFTIETSGNEVLSSEILIIK